MDAPSELFSIEHLTDIYGGPISASSFDGPLRRDRAVETQKTLAHVLRRVGQGLASMTRAPCRGRIEVEFEINQNQNGRT